MPVRRRWTAWTPMQVCELLKMRDLGCNAYQIAKRMRELGRKDCRTSEVYNKIKKLKVVPLFEKRVDRVRQLIAEGKGDTDIAVIINISVSSVKRIRHDNDIPRAANWVGRMLSTVRDKYGAMPGELTWIIRYRKYKSEGWPDIVSDKFLAVCRAVGEGKTVRQICEATGFSKSSVDALLHRGRVSDFIIRSEKKPYVYYLSGILTESRGWKNYITQCVG